MSFGRLLVEQRHHWFLYTISILGVLGAGAVYPLQAYIFANVIQVFTYTGEKLVSRGNFWSGMFGVEAAAVGVAYFVLGFASHLISIVSFLPTTASTHMNLNTPMASRDTDKMHIDPLTIVPIFQHLVHSLIPASHSCLTPTIYAADTNSLSHEHTVKSIFRTSFSNVYPSLMPKAIQQGLLRLD